MSEINLTKQNFKEEVIDSKETVLVDFFATWCGPCMMLAPILKEIAEQYEGKVKVGKVNVDEQNELAEEYQISSIPTIILFKQGKAVNKVIGFRTKEELRRIIE